MNVPIKLLIADDHPLFRNGLRQAIETDPGLRVVAEAGDGDAALRFLLDAVADVAILDVDMPGKDGFEVVRAAREQNVSIPLAILTMHRDERFLNTALDLGVQGYVLKDGAIIEIINCIKAIAAGQDYVSPSLSSYLISRSRRATALAAQKPGLSELSPNERRVLKLVADYKTSKEIADEMNVSPRTVDTYRARIAEKLDLKGAHALLKFALDHQSELD
jgi:DNA-binding NarL/FixJ family response regulator